MIDPKFNQIPVEEKGQIRRDESRPMSPEEEKELRRQRAGLSIHDTIAEDAAEGQGVDTSTVKPAVPPPPVPQPKS